MKRHKDKKKTWEKSHQLSLPQWGPYSKTYAGISHLADTTQGLRFDLSVFPGFYRRRVDPPSVLWECAWHPWLANEDLSSYTYRHQLIEKNVLFCDITYEQLSQTARHIRADFHNRSNLVQTTVLHAMTSMNYPPVRGYSSELLCPGIFDLPESCFFIHALDYAELSFFGGKHNDNLAFEGQLRGEVRGNDLADGHGLDTGFGERLGDRVVYEFEVEQTIKNAAIVFRGKKVNASAVFGVKLAGKSLTDVRFADHQFSNELVLLGDLSAGTYALEFASKEKAACELFGFFVGAEEKVSTIAIERKKWNPVPARIESTDGKSLILKYDDSNTFYGLVWNSDLFEVRQIKNSELDRFFRYKVHDHVNETLKGDALSHFDNLFIRPIVVEAHAHVSIDLMVCSGTLDEVKSQIGQYRAVEKLPGHLPISLAPNPLGEPYLFSQEKMAATLLTNLVYPIYLQNQYIVHATPGRWWDCLYTWDSGFIGIGYVGLDEKRAEENLNTYLTHPDNPHSAFIHKGSTVPVQAFLFLEIWNRFQNVEYAKKVFPSLLSYYRFYTGRSGSSTMRNLKSNLLRPWDYFYNSGGWDDYPPQVAIHKQKLEAVVTPVITTASAIRFAKILKMAAQACGQTECISELDRDINDFSKDLHQHSWHEAAGIFSYVLHDEHGVPSGKFFHESGVNYNLGSDGTSPLMSGMTTPEQEEKLLGHLFSEKNMWSKIGLSTVSQSAPYFKVDGYWNGAVWFPHQWLIWKSLLDIGRGDLADKIAMTALELWKKEVDESQYCFEHFIVATGRGAGWHQFGGLSAPVLSWFASYYRPGFLTVGFDTWVESAIFSSDKQSCAIKLKNVVEKGRKRNGLISLRPGKATLHVTSGEVTLQLVHEGCWRFEYAADKEIIEFKVEVV
jgi:hypothetical protein